MNKWNGRMNESFTQLASQQTIKSLHTLCAGQHWQVGGHVRIVLRYAFIYQY